MGYMCRMNIIQDVSAVAGCVATRRDVFEASGGFDAAYASALRDIDYSLAVRAQGKLVVWTPYAHLKMTAADNASFPASELKHFAAKWRGLLKNGDPYYNPNLSNKGDFSVDP